MIHRHTEEQIQAYFENPAINQSALKVIIDPYKGIEYFVEQQDQLQRQEDLYYEEKEYFIVGSGVDCLITQGEEIFKNKYHYVNLKKKPSDTVKSIVNMVFDRVKEYTRMDEIMPFISYKEEIYNAANEHKYSMTKGYAPSEKHLKDPTLAGVTDWHNYDNRWSYMKNVDEYWQSLKDANGKQVLSDYEYNTINNIVLSFTTHKFTKHLFADSLSTDIVYQMPMYWSYLGQDCKNLVDHIIVDHGQKKIKPIDEKTIGDYITKFGIAVKKRRYDLQGAFYHAGLCQNLDKISEIVGKDVTDYDVRPLAFIAESTIKTGVPLVFPMTEELMSIGANGDGKYLKGWKDAIKEYDIWKELNFSVEKKYEKTNGIVWLDNNFELV